MNNKITVKIFLIIFVIAVLGAVGVQIVSARRGHAWKRSTPTPVPFTFPTSTPLSSPSPTPSPVSIPTVKPTPRPSPAPTPVKTVIPLPTTPPSGATENEVSVYITYYGWNDNDPPGTAIAFPKSEFPASIHESASGAGTYSDPVTFASAPNLYPNGTKIYVPYIKKYIILEDTCAQCISDYQNGKKHIDIWMGGTGSYESKLISCEEDWTRDSQAIIVNPLSNETVDTTPLFNTSTGSCLTSI